MFKKFLLVILAVMTVASLTMCKSEKKTKVLRLVVPSPAGDWPLTWLCEDFAKRFNERADGEYKMEVHAGGALAKLPEYLDAVRTGSVEMALGPVGFYSGMEPRLSLIESPFLLNNQQAGAYATAEYSKLYGEILKEKFNIKTLGIMSLAGVELISSKEVKTMKDWKGLLVGSLSPSVSILAKSLGGAPTVIDWMEFYESLQKKVIDGVVNGTHGSLQTNLFDICKHCTLFYGVNSWNIWLLNLDVFNEMPEDIQKAMVEEGQASVDWMHNTMLELDADDLKRMKEKNVNIYTIPPAEREKWKKALASYNEEHFKKFGEFGKKIKAVADEANKKFPYTGLTLK
ncbi:MAG: TRAP transporter substrate-binding protein DctP [Spirochaetes bacterium]|nr:TRAP transporter substrate-binding protein DctP [Spirochaetota bacterium]